MGKFDKKFYDRLELEAKLSINRAQIHRKKKAELGEKAKKEVAQLLEKGKEVNKFIIS